MDNEPVTEEIRPTKTWMIALPIAMIGIGSILLANTLPGSIPEDQDPSFGVSWKHSKASDGTILQATRVEGTYSWELIEAETIDGVPIAVKRHDPGGMIDPQETMLLYGSHNRHQNATIYYGSQPVYRITYGA